MQQRVGLFSFSHTAIKYDEHFVIDWANSAHYSFQPPKPEECPPNEHRYTRIVFKGKSVTLGDDVVIKASWHVESNWDHMEAFAFNPEAPWRKEVCYKFFTDALSEELVPAVALCENNAETEVVAATGLLAIADDASVASKPGSSAASASDSKEPTQSSPAPSARPSSVRAAEQTEGVIVPLVSIPGVKKNLTPQKQMALEAVKKMLTEG